MKKQDKIDLIQKAILSRELCTCEFTYDKNRFHCYPNAVNDTFILAQHEYDFMLDGYCIRKLAHLKKIEISGHKYNEISKFLGLTAQVIIPDIDMQNWQSIFNELSKIDSYIEIEDEINGRFVIGIIEKIFKDKLHFKSFDADGVWNENALEIQYSEITSVNWDTRYSKCWKKYLERK